MFSNAFRNRFSIAFGIKHSIANVFNARRAFVVKSSCAVIVKIYNAFVIMLCSEW